MVPYFDLRDDDRGSGRRPEGAPERVDPGAAAPGQSPGAEAKTPGRLEVVFDALTRDILDEFVNETRDLLEQCEASLLVLEANPEDPEAINTAFRGFHTIKGTAACLDIGTMSVCAHHAESLFSRIRDGALPFTGAAADIALESVDMLRQLNRAVTVALREGSAPVPSRFDDLLRRLEQAGEIPGEREATNRPDAHVLPLSETAEGAVGQPTARSVPQVTEEPAPPRTADDASPRSPVESIRVRTDRLDRLIDMVGELVLAHSMIAQDQDLFASISPGLNRKVDHANKIIRELHDLSLSLRMVPLHGIFRKVTRVVRDLAQRTGKEIEFLSSGEDTEIDRNLVDLIADPLVHMVRNSLDHGIETPAERVAAGKPPRGRLLLSAAHESGNVVLRLRDDGRGLDRAKIADKAVRTGLIRSDADLTDAEIYNLLFRPGFSTAEKVTDISGRGVGLDVVRKSIDALQGRIEIASRPGEGAVFTLRLPLTLAIADGMLVRTGNQRFVIPTASICMTFKPDEGDVRTVQGRGEVVPWRDEILPVFRLARLFGLEAAAPDRHDGLLVVLQDSARRFALGVDELLHQQQVVVKALSQGIGRVYGVSGAAILGDGTVGLILDAGELRTLGLRTTSGRAAAGAPLSHASISTVETEP